MLPAFWLGLGGRVGARNQYFPWITLDDVIGGIYHALWTDALEGPVNLTAPRPVTMQAYTDTLADVLRRPAVLNVPSSVVRTVGGEMADEMLLTSARVVPERLRATGYDFGFSALEDGLRHVLGRTEA
jgi:NAD dependent epimerase/dehydratase family enzyme